MTKNMDNYRRPLTIGNEAQRTEAYFTPPPAVIALMGVEALPKVIWEPAVGTGNISRTLAAHGREVIISDIVNRGILEPHQVYDFLHADSPINASASCIEGIVTNPPFSLAAAFVDQALQCCPNVYMLLRTNFLEGGQRDPVRDMVLDKSGLRRVYVFRERLPMMHQEGWVEAGNKVASSKMTMAWFCWKRGFKGKAQVSRISWKNPKPALPPPRPKHLADPNQMEMFPDGSPASPGGLRLAVMAEQKV